MCMRAAPPVRLVQEASTTTRGATALVIVDQPVPTFGQLATGGVRGGGRRRYNWTPAAGLKVIVDGDNKETRIALVSWVGPITDEAWRAAVVGLSDVRWWACVVDLEWSDVHVEHNGAPTAAAS